MLHDWINRHLADDISLPRLADQAGRSERSFSRHYAETTGLTPARAVERLRVEAARRLLSESRLPVKRIAQRCGLARKRPCAAAFCACSLSRRRITAPASVPECHRAVILARIHTFRWLIQRLFGLPCVRHIA